MDPVFEHPVLDSAREKMKRFVRQLEKSQETLENSLYTLGLMREHQYSMTAVIVMINGEMDDTANAVNIWSKFQQYVYPSQLHQTF